MTDELATEEVTPPHVAEGILEDILNECRILAVRCGSDGRVVYLNRCAAEVLGLPESHLLGARMSDVIHQSPDCTSGCEDALSKALEQGVHSEFRFYVGAQDNRREYLLFLEPHLEDSGCVSHLSGIGIKIATEQCQLSTASDTNYLRDRFLAVVAHEIRNPLSAVSAGIKLLERRLDLAEHGDLLQKMNRQVEYLARIVSDLLDVSRIARGSLPISKTLISVSDIIDSALEICREALERKGHSLRIVLPQMSIALNGDKQRLSQVIVNLLDNAAKYTPDGGEIVVSACQDGTDVLIVVEDNGVGIPASEAPHIFELFKQLAQKDGCRRDGFGIGLYLSKMLVEAHDGDIEVCSDGAREGTRFLIRLPRLVTEERFESGLPA